LPNRPVGLVAKLIEARRRIKGVGKDSHNQHGNYAYTSAEHMLEHTREVFNDLDLLIIRMSSELNMADGITYLAQRFACIDCENGQQIETRFELPFVERRGSAADKAVLAASTTSLTYAIRDFLMLPRTGDRVIDSAQIDDSSMSTPDERGGNSTPNRSRSHRTEQAKDGNQQYHAGIQDPSAPLSDFELRVLGEFIPGFHEKGRACIDMWMSSASKWCEKQGMEKKEFHSLDELPPEFARAVIAHFQPEVDEWRRQNNE